MFAAGLDRSGVRASPLRAAIDTAAAYNRAPLAALLVLLLVEAVWLPRVGIHLTGQALLAGQAAGLALAGLCWRAAGLIATGAGWRSGPVITRAGEGAGNVAINIVFACAIATLTYLCARFALPLRDAGMVAADAAIGFRWDRWWRTLGEHPSLRAVLHLAYGSLRVQLVVLSFAMPFSGDRHRSAEFFALTTATGVVTCVLSGLLPAVGAMPWFGIPGAAWLPDLMQLRTAAAPRFDLPAMHGIVTFPSYHATLAVLYSWAARRMGLLTIAFVALNAVMLVSTPSEGGHYLVDVIAGVAIALAAIAVARRVRRLPPVVRLG